MYEDELEPLVSSSSSEASTPELVQTPRLSTELLDVDAEPFSRSFSGLFDVYEQYGGGGGENIDDIDDDEAALIYGLERNVILTATLARRLHIPPKKKQSSRVSIRDEVYRMNMTYDTERYPNLHDITIGELDNSHWDTTIYMTPSIQPPSSLQPSLIAPTSAFSISPPLSMLRSALPSSVALPLSLPRSSTAFSSSSGPLQITCASDWVKLRDIGEGGAAQVVLARHMGSGRLLAVKKSARARNGAVEHARTEVEALLAVDALRAPFLSRMHAAFEDEEYAYLVLEFCPGGDLLTHLTRVDHFGPVRTHFYASEITAALLFLHGSCIVHRDLKPENILLDHEGHIVLTDFGCAKVFPAPSDNNTPSSQRNRAFSNCGTLQYQAPEMIMGWSHDAAVDIWGLGILVHLMLVGKHPFLTCLGEDGIAEMQKTVLAPYEEPSFPYLEQNSVAKSFIVSCLEKNPLHRATIEDVAKHPYFADLGWDIVAAKGYPAPWKPDLQGELDLRYFDAPPTAFLQVSPDVHAGSPSTFSPFGHLLSSSPKQRLGGARLPQTPASPDNMMILSTSAHEPLFDSSTANNSVRIGFAQVLEQLVNAKPNPEPRDSALRAGIRLIKPIDEEENPFTDNAVSPVELNISMKQTFDEDVLSWSTPCKSRPGIRASAMIESAGGFPDFYATLPTLRQQRSVKFASGLPQFAVSFTPRHGPRQQHVSPSPRRKRSILTPLRDITSSVQRKVSGRLGRSSSSQATLLRHHEATPPPLPPLPPGIKRLGNGIGFTPSRNTRRNGAHIASTLSSRRSNGLLGRLWSNRRKKEASVAQGSSPDAWDDLSDDLTGLGLYSMGL